jgi:POT family proton-dependent oligopeptide transporter
MLFAVSQFALGQHTLGAAGLPAGKRELDARDWLQVAAIGVLMVPLVYLVLGAWANVSEVWKIMPAEVKIAIPAMAFAGFFAWQRGSCSREEWRRLMAIVIMGVFVIFFWMGFEQAGGTMNLFADKLTERSLFGWEIPASYFQGINPLLIVLLGPLFS